MKISDKLNHDSLYKSVIENIPEGEREKVDEYVKEYIRLWDEEFFSPLENFAQDPAFLDELSKLLNGHIDTNKE